MYSFAVSDSFFSSSCVLCPKAGSVVDDGATGSGLQLFSSTVVTDLPTQECCEVITLRKLFTLVMLSGQGNSALQPSGYS